MKDLLKMLTCGSVDDGKSTLMGHMLYETKQIYADQKQALLLDSQIRNQDSRIDYSLLFDGLTAEREQGITIDVAYRFFTTERRRFIIADAPGHEEYTRNMAVAASFADLAIVLIDVTKGVVAQTSRHIQICSLMGIQHIVVAVNKMDLVNYEYKPFDDVCQDIQKLLSKYSFFSNYLVPVSAINGDNLIVPSDRMKWFSGEPLLPYLEGICVDNDNMRDNTFIFPIQRVCRNIHNSRGLVGSVESGRVSVGDEVRILPSGEKARICEIYVMDKKAERAVSGEPITLTLDREIDVSRGCVIEKQSKVCLGNYLHVRILWMDNDPLVVGRSFYLRIGTQKVPAFISEILSSEKEKTGVTRNEVIECLMRTGFPVVFEEGGAKYPLGRFVLIDRIKHTTAGCGVVDQSAEKRTNVYSFDTSVTRELRASVLNQQPVTLWFTGLSGSGKSTIASALEKELISLGKHTMTLDGDNIRLGINRHLGFTMEDRAENNRIVAEIAKLMNDAGLIVLVAMISPFRQERQMAKSIIGDSFLEVYVKASVQTCEKRDVKGLYKRARNNEISEFTGVSSPYEEPLDADLVLDTEKMTVSECVKRLTDVLFRNENVMSELRPSSDDVK